MSPIAGVILERLSSAPLQKSSSFLGSRSGDSSPVLSEVSISSTGSVADVSARTAAFSAAASVKNEREQASPQCLSYCMCHVVKQFSNLTEYLTLMVFALFFPHVDAL